MPNRIPGILALTIGFAACQGTANEPPLQPQRVLVITETQGFRHTSIPNAVALVEDLGRETGMWRVVGVVDDVAAVAAAVTAAGLDTVDMVVFANTTGDLSFTNAGRAAFYAWMTDGGAFVGIHSASDTFHGDAEYLDLLGGEFLTHGPLVTVKVVAQLPRHPATQELPDSFDVFDEIYEFTNFSRTPVHTLLALRKHPQTGAPGDYPLAWAKRFGTGRVFYTALGHREEIYDDPRFRAHVAGGIQWALGLVPGDLTTGNPPR